MQRLWFCSRAFPVGCEGNCRYQFRGGVFCDHMQTLTSSAVVTYKFLERTTMTGQMLFASGLRTAENEEAKTNWTHSPSYTIYNLSIAHVFPLPWDGQKFCWASTSSICWIRSITSTRGGQYRSGWLMRGCRDRSSSVANGSSRSDAEQGRQQQRSQSLSLRRTARVRLSRRVPAACWTTLLGICFGCGKMRACWMTRLSNPFPTGRLKVCGLADNLVGHLFQTVRKCGLAGWPV